MFKRLLDLKSTLERKSVFLFGPRQTGKSTYLKYEFPNALYINFLSNQTFRHYSINSNALESDIQSFVKKPKSNIVIIDEIQKMPHLLDEVHNQIEINKKIRFILTGSSSKKLKRSGVNLLGGRATWKNMFPLTYPEMKSELKSTNDLTKRILIGGIPSIYLSEFPFEDFDDYIQLYLNEEIQAEGLIRNIDGFHRFLSVAALTNSKQINFTQVGNDSQVPPRTIHDYFQILEDTLIGFMLPAYTNTSLRKAMTSAKFYFFDTGITNALLNRTQLSMGTPEFGEMFEHYIITEVRAYLSYKNVKAEMSYWRSTTKFEVDLILKTKNSIYAIEIKAKNQLTSKDFSGLLAFSEDHPTAKKTVICLNSKRFVDKNKVEIISAIEFLNSLWAGEIF